jgi:hypothetical protein
MHRAADPGLAGHRPGRLMSENNSVGLVGYFYDQIIGCEAMLGSFESRLAGVGRQIGYLIPIGATRGLSKTQVIQEDWCAEPSAGL